MPQFLTRLKPDPLPTLNPVPEYAAEGALLDVYERTKRGLGVPWMGVVTMAFAHYPTFYAALWSAVEPLVGRQRFHEACDALRAEAETQGACLNPHALNARLQDMGYGAAEVAEIRSCIEVFSAGNMPYVLMATLARSLLEGQNWQGQGEAGPASSRPQHAKPALMEAHHADQGTVAVYDELKETLGLPFVNTDYRAFARWPSYFREAWGDLRRMVLLPGYSQAVDAVHLKAQVLVQDLPNLSGITAEDLQAAARKDAPLQEVLAVVQLFQWLLPGLAVNVACLRQQLEPA